MNPPGTFSKTLGIIASVLLLLMAIFHGSGINFINAEVQASNVSGLVKDIFPVLFILPSLQLLGFAVLGIIASFMKQKANKILIPLSILVLVDAMLAFYLHASIPGLVLLVPSLLFARLAYGNYSQSK